MGDYRRKMGEGSDLSKRRRGRNSLASETRQSEIDKVSDKVGASHSPSSHFFTPHLVAHFVDPHSHLTQYSSVSL